MHPTVQHSLQPEPLCSFQRVDEACECLPRIEFCITFAICIHHSRGGRCCACRCLVRGHCTAIPIQLLNDGTTLTQMCA
jgi:hypothetical protein